MFTDGSNVGDYLTGSVAPSERKVKPGFGTKFPRTVANIRTAPQNSTIYFAMRDGNGWSPSPEAQNVTDEFKRSVVADRHPSFPKMSQLPVPLGAHIL